MENNIVHTVVFSVFDISKLKSNVKHTISSKILDNTSQHQYNAMIHVTFKCNYKQTFPPISILNKADTIHNAAESNLNLIKPYSNIGLEPVTNVLNRIHSPFYTSNLGFQLPSGAFLLDCGSETILESHLTRLKTAIKCTGNTEDFFITNANELDKHIESVLVILHRTLTMHALHCVKYVSDVSFDENDNKIETDRWECPRFDSNSFVGDCEDCSKEIFVEIDEWNRFKSDNPLVLAMQHVLSFYIPVVIQGCVKIQGEYKNHIWSALISKHEFHKNLSCTLDIERKKYLPTVLLEGTGSTYPLFLNKSRRKNMKRDIKKIKKYIHGINEMDVTPFGFYKYVVACMTPKWKKNGIIDFVYTKNNKYGVTFKNWWKGNYNISPACRHSKHVMKSIDEIVRYDRPIHPLTYSTNLSSSFGIAKSFSSCNIVFGYKLKSVTDKHHVDMVKVAKKINKTFTMYGNVIDHGISLWSEWVIHKKESPGLVLLH